MNKDQKAVSNNVASTNDRNSLPKRWFFSRIICFFFALGIWVYVVNITTQDFEKTFSLIDIDVEGWEELQDSTNMSVVNLEESKVSITVKGLRSDISKLTANDFAAYIDVSRLQNSGKHRLEVAVNLPSTVSLVSKYPESVTISVDENAEREFDIDIDITEYSIDLIYEMGKPTSDITSVNVKGPLSVLDRVKSAKAFINLGTVMTSSVIRTEIVLIDKAGNSIDTTFLSMDSTSVTVVVPVTMEKTINLACEYLPGVDSSRYSSVNISPSTIRVKGDPKVLNEIDRIVVLALDGAGNTAVSVNFSTLLLPGGVEVINAPLSIQVIADLNHEISDTDEVTTNTEPISEPMTQEETTEIPVY